MLSCADKPLVDPISHKEKMDIFEGAMAKMPQVNLPLVHRFTPGLYSRTITMPAGTVVTSRTHKTTHPFIVTKGVVDVVDEEGRIERITAPYFGTTHAGTRRALVTLEDTEWTTFHVTDKTNPEEIGDEITESSNELLPDGFKQLWSNTKEELWLGQ